MRKESRASKAFKKAFLELIKEMPINKITATAIVRRAEYSRSAFYFLYPTLEDFYKMIVRDEIDNYLEISRQAYASGREIEDSFPPVSLLRLFEYVYSKRDLYTFIFNNYEYYNTFEEFSSGTSAGSAVFELSFEDDYPPIHQGFYNYLSSSIQKACVRYWIDQNFEWTPEYMAEQCALFYRKRLRSAKLV